MLLSMPRSRSGSLRRDCPHFPCDHGHRSIGSGPASAMSRASSRLLSIESPFPEAHSMLRVLEPPGSCHEILCKRLFDGTYDKPFIVDNGRRRFLHFDFDAVQSAMETQDPHKLTLAYTRKMMAFLLFKRDPGRILLLGLGGGSLAKFCYKHLGSVALTAIEVN